jgi:hypothetical protein
LTVNQQLAITKMRQYTDFNDLVIKKVLGREGLDRQITTRVNRQKEQDIAQQHHLRKQEQFEDIKQQFKVIKIL